MKQLIIVLTLLSISITCFALPIFKSQSEIELLNTLHSTWRAKQSHYHINQYKHDIKMGYGGADISRQFVIMPHHNDDTFA